MYGFNKKGSKAPAMPNNIGAPLNPVRNGNAPFFGGTSAPSNVMRPNQNPSRARKPSHVVHCHGRYHPIDMWATRYATNVAGANVCRARGAGAV